MQNNVIRANHDQTKMSNITLIIIFNVKLFIIHTVEINKGYFIAFRKVINHSILFILIIWVPWKRQNIFVVDSFTKYVRPQTTKTINSSEVIKYLKEYFAYCSSNGLCPDKFNSNMSWSRESSYESCHSEYDFEITF